MLLLRGALGGALGGFILVATLILIQFGTFGSGAWLVLGYLLFGLPCGAFIGILVGTTIPLINRQAGLNVGVFGRVIVGTLIATIFWGLFFLGKEASAYTNINSWLWFVFAVLLFSLPTGGIAGLVVGGQSTSVNSPGDDQAQKSFEKKELDREERAV